MAIVRSEINAAFGKVLKGIVRENDKTQEGAAGHIGQSIRTIGRIFAGERDVTVKQFIEISDYCGEDPQVVLARVMAKLATMSQVPDNVITLKPVSAMSDEEVEELRGVAGSDPELGEDEPDQT